MFYTRVVVCLSVGLRHNSRFYWNGFIIVESRKQLHMIAQVSGWATVYKTVRPILSDRCLSVLSFPVYLSVTLVYCGQFAPPPKFRPMSVVAKTAGWIKMPLGREVGLGQGDSVLDEDSALRRSPPPKGAPQIFGQCLLSPNGWMNQDVTCYGGRPRCRRHCVRWRTQIPLKGGTVPTLRRMYIVVKRSPIPGWALIAQVIVLLNPNILRFR